MTHRRRTQSVRTSPRHRGFTMAEMVVAVTIMVIVTAIVASLFVQVRKMIGMTQWGSETRAQLRTVVGTLAQDLENVDTKAYFIMLNRDYGWDTTAAQTPVLTTATARAPVLYPNDPSTGDRRFWADRLAFIANGPFNTLQNFQAGNAPVIGTTARVYYGQSLWTHELADMWWASQIPAVAAALDPFQPQGGSGPSQMAAWPGDFSRRPAVDWNLLRQAVLHVPDPVADYALGNFLGLTREVDWRAAIDNEFTLLSGSLIPNLYTNDELGAKVEAWRSASSKDWAALLWPPRVDGGSIGTGPVPSPDPSIMARCRVLLPHAARLRFQVRLSDGTIVPQLNETDENPRLRGGLKSPVYPLAQDYALPYPQPALNAYWSFGLADPSPTGTPNSVHPTAQPTYQVPLKQAAYIWTPTNTNVPPSGGTMLYPVAVRIRIEVYDPQKRTPDPIRLDEWLPVRWQHPG
jgi:prepilin-type N-terminal cleavage/methylation domain-containing protein